jgi:hypothetical protein
MFTVQYINQHIAKGDREHRRQQRTGGSRVQEATESRGNREQEAAESRRNR